MNKKNIASYPKETSLSSLVISSAEDTYDTNLLTNPYELTSSTQKPACQEISDNGIHSALIREKIQHLLFFEQSCYRLHEQLSQKTEEILTEVFSNSKYKDDKHFFIRSFSPFIDSFEDISCNEKTDDKKNSDKACDHASHVTPPSTQISRFPSLSHRTTWALHAFYLGVIFLAAAYTHQTKSPPNSPHVALKKSIYTTTTSITTPSPSPSRSRSTFRLPSTNLSPRACPPPPRCLLSGPEKTDAPITSLAFVPDPRGLVYEEDETNLLQKNHLPSAKTEPR